MDPPVRKQFHKDKADECLENPPNSKTLIPQDISANTHSPQKVQLFGGASSHLYVSQTFVEPIKISKTC